MTGEPAVVLHHLSLPATDLDAAGAFYDAALGALGYARVWTEATAIGYGPPGDGDKLAIKAADEVPSPPAGFHVAFAAPDRAAVDAFHRAGLGHGGRDNGPPGPRPEYGPSYYAAYLLDPDGHPVEAVINE